MLKAIFNILKIAFYAFAFWLSVSVTIIVFEYIAAL